MTIRDVLRSDNFNSEFPYGSTLLGDEVTVRGERCDCLGCCTCGGRKAKRTTDGVIRDMLRMGVDATSMWTFTSAPKRFSEWDHVKAAKVVSKVMAFMWPLLPKTYLKRWGADPVWWNWYHLHEGKRGGGEALGRVHAHVLFPSPGWLGRVGWLKREVLDAVDRYAESLSGRATFGWVRESVKNSSAYSLPVSSAGGYLAAGVSYASQGVSQVPDSMLGLKRFDATSRSEAVRRSCPVRLERVEKKLELDAKKKGCRAECWGLIWEARRAGDLERVRDLKYVVKHGFPRDDSRGKRSPMRTIGERREKCQSTVTIVRDGVGEKVDVPMHRFRSFAELVYQAGDLRVHYADDSREALAIARDMGILDHQRGCLHLPADLVESIAREGREPDTSFPFGRSPPLPPSSGTPSHKPGSVKSGAVSAGRENAQRSRGAARTLWSESALRGKTVRDAFSRLTGSGVVIHRGLRGQGGSSRASGVGSGLRGVRGVVGSVERVRWRRGCPTAGGAAVPRPILVKGFHSVLTFLSGERGPPH